MPLVMKHFMKFIAAPPPLHNGERMRALDLNFSVQPPLRSDYPIGVVGAGFAMQSLHLPAYRNAGFPVFAISSRTTETARELAHRFAIPHVYDSVGAMVASGKVELLDVAVPPDQQLAVVRQIVGAPGRVRGLLLQKPLAMTLAEATEIVSLCQAAGIRLIVNQNMRYDASIRALKTLVSRRLLGDPVLFTITMHAPPHWQPWVSSYPSLTLLNLSVHHLDCCRHLLGEPEFVFCSARPDQTHPQQDGICLTILEYQSGVRAMALENTAARFGAPSLKWRWEGTTGWAAGQCGWPGYPNRVPSRLRYSLGGTGVMESPVWDTAWFPDAFEAPMGALMDAVTNNENGESSGVDNLNTMALVEAARLSLKKHCPIRPVDVPVLLGLRRQ